MQCGKSVLHVRPNAERSCGADEDTNLAAAHFIKEFLLILVRNFLHNSNFFTRNPALNELFANVIVDVKATFSCARRCGFIAEKDLRTAL